MCYRYLALLHCTFEYLVGETTVCEIFRDCCDSTWDCLKTTEMPEKTEDDWMNISNDFYQRTQFPICIGAEDGKHIRIKMPTGSGSLFYNYKRFFSIVLLASVDANYCFIAIDVGAVGKASDSNIFKNSDI